MSKKSSSQGKPVSPEKQAELDEVYNALKESGVFGSKSQMDYFKLVTEYANQQMVEFGIQLADPELETETRSFKFQAPDDLSMPPKSLAEIYVNEILVGFGSENIKQFTVVNIIGLTSYNNRISAVLRGKWESK
jgi:hypothetical protein